MQRDVGQRRVRRILAVSVTLFILTLIAIPGALTVSQVQAAVAPISRTASYSYTNSTLSSFPSVSPSPQQSAPFNASLLDKMVGLLRTTTNTSKASASCTFFLAQSEPFLALDGASQSEVLPVRVDVHAPGGGNGWSVNTTSSHPLHLLLLAPQAGIWNIKLTLTTPGNTTAWVQAVSYEHGARLVTDYHKERTHLYAGQAIYFKIPVGNSSDWFWVYATRLAGATASFRVFDPGTNSSITPSYTNQIDLFRNSKNSLLQGTYLLTVTDTGSSDVQVGITRPAGVTASAAVALDSPFSVKMKLDNENNFWYLGMNQALPWIDVASGIQNSSAQGTVILVDPNYNIVYNSGSNGKDMMDAFLKLPPVGKYILVVRGLANIVVNVQISSPSAATSLSAKSDRAIGFVESGQTLIFSINPGSNPYFAVAAQSLSVPIENLQVLDSSLGSVLGESLSSSMQVTPIQVASNSYLICLQGEKASRVMFHFRFASDQDYTLQTPDYSDFKMRFNGDFIVYKVVIRSGSSYLSAYWHSLSTQGVEAWMFSNTLTGVSASFSSASSDYMDSWQITSTSSVSWIGFVAGSANGMLRSSTLQSGDEEKSGPTPYQTFASFGFDYQAKVYTVNVPAAGWLYAVTQGQTNAFYTVDAYTETTGLPIRSSFNTNLASAMNQQFYTNLASGTWLVLIAGTSTANVSMTFHASVDPSTPLPLGSYTTQKSTYNGFVSFYSTNLAGRPFLDFSAMQLASGPQSYVSLISPSNTAVYSSSASAQFSALNGLVNQPANGTWYLAVAQTKLDSLIFRTVDAPDTVASVPPGFTRNYFSLFDGQSSVTAISVQSPPKLWMNLTSSSASPSFYWVYGPDGTLYFSGSLSSWGQERSLQWSTPKSGNWFLAVIQEQYANLTVTSNRSVRPSGVLVSFIEPESATIVSTSGSRSISPQLSGSVPVEVSVVDYYHKVVSVILFWNGGVNSTRMTLDFSTGYYRSALDTTRIPDGLGTLVALGQSDAGEVGVGAIVIFVSNNGTSGSVGANGTVTETTTTTLTQTQTLTSTYTRVSISTETQTLTSTYTRVSISTETQTLTSTYTLPTTSTYTTSVTITSTSETTLSLSPTISSQRGSNWDLSLVLILAAAIIIAGISIGVGIIMRRNRSPLQKRVEEIGKLRLSVSKRAPESGSSRPRRSSVSTLFTEQ